MLGGPLRRAAPLLLAALALGSCGGSHGLGAPDAAKLVSERFVRIAGVTVHDVSCQSYAGTAAAVAYLCQTGRLDGRPVEALVTRSGGHAAQAVPTLSVGRLQRMIERGDFARKAGVPVLAASCPRGVRYERGADSTCEVAFLGSEREPATVTQTDGRGGFEISSPNYIATKLELAIGARLAAHRVHSAVRCPRGVRITTKASFSCRLAGGRGRVRVLAIDADGGVRFELPGR